MFTFIAPRIEVGGSSDFGKGSASETSQKSDGYRMLSEEVLI